MFSPVKLVAEIPVVPLPPAPIRPVGRQAETSPLLASAPWVAAGVFAILLTLLLLKLRRGLSADGELSEWAPWSSGPQVKPVRDPKYWSLILQAERESSQQSSVVVADSSTDPQIKQVEDRSLPE